MRWSQSYGSLNILWHCLSLGLEWKLTFSSPVATAEFFKFAGILSAALSQHHLAVLGWNLKNDRMISVLFQGKPFNIIVIQDYAPTSNAEEAEAERFFEDLQDLLELSWRVLWRPTDLLELRPQRDVLYIIGDWNAKVGSQETPGVTGKFGLGVWNEAGQKPTDLCQENALVIANTLFQQHRRRFYT